MTRKKVDKHTKAIVKGIMAKERERNRRRRLHTMTEFDRLADAAVRAADKKASMDGYSRDAREKIIRGIHKSLGDGVPWEKLPDIYVGRRLFYDLRTEFMYNVGVDLGLIREK